MARNLIVINVDLRETRVALIENGVVAELQIERASHRGTVGDIVLGRVTRVLPGMQAAFIDVGHERAAFLHVEDLIRPNDLEAYLSGGPDEESSFRGDGTRQGTRPLPQGTDGASPALGNGASSDDLEVLVREGSDEDDEDDEDDDNDLADRDSANEDTVSPDPEGSDENDLPDDDTDDDEDDEALDDEDGSDDTDEDDLIEADAEDGEDDDLIEEVSEIAASPLGTSDAAGDSASSPIAVSDEWDMATPKQSDDAHAAYVAGNLHEPEPSGAAEDGELRPAEDAASENGTAAAPSSDSDPSLRQGRGRRRRRKRRRSGERQPEARELARDPSPRKASRERGRDAASLRNNRRNKAMPLRVTRSVPITEVVREGDEVIVQVSKEPIGTKGARVTSHVSLPGRYVVYLPTVDHIGISKRIGSSRERGRLRQVIDTLKPAKGGLIVRTVAEGLTKKQLKADIGYLIRLWSDVFKRKEGAKAPEVLYTELDLVLKVARDLFTDEVDRVVIDDREQYGRLVRFVEMFMPERVSSIELYQGDEPIFDAYGIEDEIGRALSRKVPLPSGGSLIVDQAEALTAIDVNTGRYVGKGSRDLEETALKTNLEAVEEIAYQLRFRNIGGLVILDLIDMEKPSNREKVWRSLEQSLAKDKAKTTINRISELGLIEMTRKRTRESLGRVLHEPCFYCDGTGQIQSRETIAYEILRQIRRERMNLPGYSVIVNAHPAVVDFLKGDARDALHEAERRFARKIELVARQEYHIEQSDLQGK